MLGQRFPAVDQAVNIALASRIVPEDLSILGTDYRRLVQAFIREALVQGMLTSEDVLRRLREREAFRTTITAEPVVPQEAIDWMNARSALLGKWPRDLDAQVQSIISQGLQQGSSRQVIMAELRAQVFSSFSFARLENIARTETTAAYNHGLLAGFAQPDSGVVAVQYVAILDSRTTDICRARNGLVLPIDSDKLIENTPPLHYQCRSVLSPITEYAMEKLKAGDARYQQRHFGYLDDEFALNPPKTLDEALAGWAQVPPPQTGFGQLGGVSQPTVRPVKPALRERVAQAVGSGIKTPEDAVRVGKVVADEVERRLANNGIDKRIDALRAEENGIWPQIRDLREKAAGVSEAGEWRGVTRKLTKHQQLRKAKDEAADLVPKDSNDPQYQEKFDAFMVAFRALSKHETNLQRPFIKQIEQLEDGIRELRRRRGEAMGNPYGFTMTEVLSEIRGMGRPDDQRVWANRPNKNVQAYERSANGYYPTAWWSRMPRLRGQTAKRGFHNAYTMTVAADNHMTMVHELGHAFENQVPDMQRLANEFYESRTAGNPLKLLADKFKGHGYARTELYRDDLFVHDYMAKDYSKHRYHIVKRQDGTFERLSTYDTEIISMGVEYTVQNKAGIWQKDRGSVEFILGLIAGLP